MSVWLLSNSTKRSRCRGEGSGSVQTVSVRGGGGGGGGVTMENDGLNFYSLKLWWANRYVY